MIVMLYFTLLYNFLNERKGYKIMGNIPEIAHNIQAILYMCFIP